MTRLLLLAVLAVLAAAPAVSQTCSTEWAAPVDGVWTVATNWTSGVPEAGDNACITASGTYTVSLGGASVTVASLTLGGASGTQTLTSSGVISIATGGTLDVAPSGTLHLIGSGSRLSGASALFRIRGLLDVTGCPAPNTGSCNVDVPLEVIGGTVRAGGGVLHVRGGALLRDATLDVAADAQMILTVLTGPEVYTIEGTVGGDVQGLLLVDNELRASAAGGTLNFGGNGLLASRGTFFSVRITTAGGVLRNTGLLRSGGLGMQFQRLTFENEGTLQCGGCFVNGGAVVRNRPGGTFEIQDSGGINGTANPAEGRVENAGLIVHTGTGTGNVNAPLDGLPGSTIRAAAGALGINTGGSLNGVAFDVAAGASVSIGSARFVVEGTLTGDIQGTLSVYDEWSAGPAGVTFAFTGTGLRTSRTTFYATPLTSSGGTFRNTGVFTAGGNGTALQQAVFENEGTVRIVGGLQLQGGAVLRNLLGGTVELHSSMSGNGLFENAGLVVTAGTGFAVGFGGQLQSVPGSEIRTLAGGPHLDLDAPGSRTLPEGAFLTGTGTITLPTTLFLEGTVSPGTEETPIATLQPTSTFRLAPSARTVIDVASDGVSDRLGDVDFNGYSYTLGGTLVVRIRPGYTPAVGDAFTFIRNGVGAVGGAFDAVEVEGGPPGLTFAVDTSNPGAAVLRAVVGVAIEAPVASVAEGTPTSFVFRHAASAVPFTINVETGGTATPFADYTLAAPRGVVRAAANTTQTVVELFPRRDANAAEGAETVTLRIVGSNTASASGPAEATVSIVDGPSSEVLALDAIVPARGANLGRFTPTVLGQGFGEGTSVRLVGSATVEGAQVALDPTGAGAQATFDLSEAPLGVYDVVVERGGTSATLAGAFTVVESEIGVPVWADISGTVAPRLGRWSTYTLTVGNDGDVDLYDTFVLLRLTPGLEYEVRGLYIPQNVPAGAEDFVGLDAGTAILVPVYFYKLPARSSQEVAVLIRPPTSEFTGGDGVGVSYELYPPNPFASFTYSGDFLDFDADLAAGVLTNWGVIGASFEFTLDQFSQGANLSARTASLSTGSQVVDCDPENGLPRDGRLIQDIDVNSLQNRWGTAATFEENKGEIASNAPSAWSEYAGFALGVVSAGGALVFGAPVAVAATVAVGTFAVATFVMAGQSAGRISSSRAGLSGGGRLAAGGSAYGRGGSTGGMGGAGGDGAGGDGTGGAGGGPAGGIGGGAGGCAGGSRDPNDKFGPAGTGDPRFYDPAIVSTPYVVRFENVETASFPAQEVVVTDVLDPAVFDLSTVSLGPIRWGNGHVLTPPPGAKAYEAEVDLAPEVNARLLVTASLDETTGQMVWHFVTLDPTTDELPEDGTVGFLPPNGTQPEGEGSVSFTVEAREGLATGAAVANRAEIVFDVNDPITTPVWTNTVDVTPPVTSVEPLASGEQSPITITVGGGDVGSGVYLYQLFASQDGGPFEFVAQSSEPVFEFEGEVGSQYGFYSIASDAVLNFERSKTTAEATTTVAVAGESGPAVPAELTLDPARPNPTRALAHFRYGLPAAGAVRVRVFDVLGREVASLVERQTAAGWYTVEWAPAVASGLYVVRLEAGGEVRTQRMTVVR